MTSRRKPPVAGRRRALGEEGRLRNPSGRSPRRSFFRSRLRRETGRVARARPPRRGNPAWDGSPPTREAILLAAEPIGRSKKAKHLDAPRMKMNKKHWRNRLFVHGIITRIHVMLTYHVTNNKIQFSNFLYKVFLHLQPLESNATGGDDTVMKGRRSKPYF
ncbi:hypothetical protein OPV22_029253 [Ensete ventricosum]|uniref:Uncharacterized protein n=1 Tax=Ensete ventricosum TaxID=4639 RepID=A0AAV8QAT3_ENSVE|nr:hypothetical protein OPV22_029253 [Ensete ventricosum]